MLIELVAQPLVHKRAINMFKLDSSVVVQAGLCQTWSETQRTGFLQSGLKCGTRWTFR